VIQRKFARRLLDEYLDRLRREDESHAHDPDDSGGVEVSAFVDMDDLEQLRDKTLDESPLVIRGTENVEQKGKRYAIEGRLRVEKIEASGLIVATCRGTGATYSLGYDPKLKQWRCTCSIEHGGKRTRRCSHLAALQLVVDEPSAA
jgi:hypothetical protein